MMTHHTVFVHKTSKKINMLLFNAKFLLEKLLAMLQLREEEVVVVEDLLLALLDVDALLELLGVDALELLGVVALEVLGVVALEVLGVSDLELLGVIDLELQGVVGLEVLGLELHGVVAVHVEVEL